MSKKTPKVSPKARRLVMAFAARTEDYAFLGSAHPDEHQAIDRGYHRTRDALLAYIEELEKRQPTAASFVEPN